MLASSILVICGLVAVAQSALMPRQSTTGPVPGCFRCPEVFIGGYDIQGEGYLQTNDDLLCRYYDPTGLNRLNCVFDGTTGALIAPSDPPCNDAVAGPATAAAFQCASAVDPWELLYFELDSAGDTACYYGISTSDPPQDTCQYDSTGEFEEYYSGVDCADTPLSCGSTSRRAYKGDNRLNNLAVVKRRQAARAAEPTKFPSRRLVLDSTKEA